MDTAFRSRGAPSGCLSLFLPAILTVTVAFPQVPSGNKVFEPFYGITLESESHGSALGGFYSFAIKNKIQYFLQGRIVDIAGEAEFPVYDWYTGTYYKSNVKNLFLLPLSGGVKYHPFAGQIANNFSPFFMFTAGPTIILDLPEGVGFVEQWRRLHTMFSGSAFAGVGLDFLVRHNSFFSIAMGYDYLPMGRTVDDRKDYSGMLLKFMIGRKRKQ